MAVFDIKPYKSFKMTYKFKEIPNSQILEVKLQGVLSNALRVKVLREASVRISFNGYNRLLVDTRETTISNSQLSFDAIPLVDGLKIFGFHPPKKLAFLKKEDHAIRTLFEKAASQEGLNVKYFDNKEEAIEWLCKS
jgi:hypothetical protein